MTDKISTADGKYLLEPKDALTLIKRLRSAGACSIHVMIEKAMPVSDTHAFPGLVSMCITIGQATKILKDLQSTHDVRVDGGKDEPKLRVTLTTLDDRKKSRMIFI